MASNAPVMPEHHAGTDFESAAANGAKPAGSLGPTLRTEQMPLAEPESRSLDEIERDTGIPPVKSDSDDDRENLRLIRWARREAPELLEILKSAYLTGARALPALLTAAYNRIVKPPRTVPDSAPPSDASLKLRDVEREHLRKVLADSRTVAEAARRLGIDTATLWRKRKRYRLMDGPGPRT
jgi:hypothetical protein